jgi:hypothetical protein
MAASTGIDGLIEALKIFRKYGNPPYPTACRFDELIIVGITPEQVSDEDKASLDKLGFIVSNEDDECECFKSFRYGSA